MRQYKRMRRAPRITPSYKVELIRAGGFDLLNRLIDFLAQGGECPGFLFFFCSISTSILD